MTRWKRNWVSNGDPERLQRKMRGLEDGPNPVFARAEDICVAN